MDGERFPTPAQTFADAVYAADPDELSTVEAMVLLLYARAAKRGADSAWLTQRRIMREGKISSHETAVRVRRSVVEKGWLQPLDVMIIRGGRIQVYRLAIPESDTTAVSGSGDPDTTSVSGESHSDTVTVSGRAESDTTGVSGRTPDSVTVSGEDGSDTVGVSVGDTKRYGSDPDLIRSSSRSDTVTESGIPPQDGPPFRGGSMSGARGGAQAHARVREAPEDPNHLSIDRKETLTRDQALSMLRRTLPPGKPLSRYPAEPSTDVDRPRGPSTNVDAPADGGDLR
jgi:hypothetical protein